MSDSRTLLSICLRVGMSFECLVFRDTHQAFLFFVIFTDQNSRRNVLIWWKYLAPFVVLFSFLSMLACHYLLRACLIRRCLLSHHTCRAISAQPYTNYKSPSWKLWYHSHLSTLRCRPTFLCLSFLTSATVKTILLPSFTLVLNWLIFLINVFHSKLTM